MTALVNRQGVRADVPAALAERLIGSGTWTAAEATSTQAKAPRRTTRKTTKSTQTEE
ncbi:DUF7302 family protein [Gordonia sp. DT101]|uniref:DUF7302 family protein n=1 Tax=Gordonia sp. DT101 TaxID=3416545 RepID=UPI003CF7AD82